jgi:NAD dependent epimerase/dehydratase family enzyme
MKNIGIIGAGWLGKSWVERINTTNKYSYFFTNQTGTSDFLSERCISFQFGEDLKNQDWKKLDFLYICSTIPRESETILHHFVQQLTQHLPPHCTVIFTSTIGVYSESEVTITEESQSINKENTSWKMEQLLQRLQQKVIILRLGGLIGEDRHPIFSLSKKGSVTKAQEVVNLVHKEDILDFFEVILTQNVPSGIYNIVYPEHPSKEAYYTQKAKEYQLNVPEMNVSSSVGKLIDSSKSSRIDGFQYRHKI